jgi:hypothetical protein
MFRRIANCFVPAPYLPATPTELVYIKLLANSYRVVITLHFTPFLRLKPEVIYRELPWS